MARSEGDILKVILSVLLPPVGVAMEVGFTAQFWINVVLTLLGYIPGIIHALWIILRR
ncbi:YqaE/Pmp3 family membrane protein [Hyphococcus lacteus]|uniref:YqaE/Pmp3 family membrane protein n=1 Tax=Hyphococcus lacteus TaxID=3143536 RepID=A0ABV3Z4A3_9PROT